MRERNILVAICRYLEVFSYLYRIRRNGEFLKEHANFPGAPTFQFSMCFFFLNFRTVVWGVSRWAQIFS